MIQAGKLDKKITIQQRVAGSPQQTAAGEPDETWTALLTDISARWITLRGDELFAAQERHSETVGVWRIRWRDGISGGMRIVHDGLNYNIHWVPPYDRIGKRWQLDLECSQGVNAG